MDQREEPELCCVVDLIDSSAGRRWKEGWPWDRGSPRKFIVQRDKQPVVNC